jgi:hypothetical protein
MAMMTLTHTFQTNSKPHTRFLMNFFDVFFFWSFFLFACGKGNGSGMDCCQACKCFSFFAGGVRELVWGRSLS